MHKLIRVSSFVVVLLGTAAAVSAATPGEFYLGLLRRGTASFEASRHADAVKQLKIAAFGLLEAVEHYQTAQVYLTLAYDKLQDSDRAREAAHRVYLAERVERKYAGLKLPADIRTAFEALAGKLMSPSESAALLRGAEMPAPAPATPQRAVSTSASAQTTPSTPRRTTTPPQTKPVAQPPAQTTSQPRNTIPAPKTTTPENTAPQTVAATPQPEKPKTVTPAPQTTKPQTSAQTVPQPQTTKPQQTTTTTKVVGAETDGRGGPIEPARPTTPAAAPAPRPLSASEVAARMATAERSLTTGNLGEARRVYREILGTPGLDHESLVRVAEGLYRSRDFSSALTAFNRAGTLRRGEEPYRYYIAVALYETGDLARAKKELAAALPYIEVTPDVARYRTKIEGSM